MGIDKKNSKQNISGSGHRKKQNKGQRPRPRTRLGLVVLITFLVTALILGGGIYLWQKERIKDLERRYSRKINTLKEQVNTLESYIGQYQDGESNGEDEEATSGIGRIKTCDWTGFSDCSDFANGIGKCYQIKTKNGWEIVEYSEVGDLKEYVGHEVKWHGIRADNKPLCTKSCPCSIKLKSIEGVKIGEPVGLPAVWELRRKEKVEYGYPQTVDGNYINVVEKNWPPQVIVNKASKPDFKLLCEPKETRIEMTNDEDVCFSKTTEGASGINKEYVRYAYRAKLSDRRVDLVFTLVFPSCGALSEPGNCQEAQTQFNSHQLASKIFASIVFTD